MVASTPETAPFWEACQRRELVLPYCLACARHFFYPRSFCPSCYSSDLEWRTVSGRGTLASWIVVHRTPPGVELLAPYVVGLVDLEEGPSMLSNIVGSNEGRSLSIDVALQVEFDSRAPGGFLTPVFRPVARQ